MRVQGGDVGASAALSPERGESFAVDLAAGPQAAADVVERVLEDAAGLQAVAECAAAAARAYDELANAQALIKHVRDHLLQESSADGNTNGSTPAATTVAA